ncbi:MAG: amidophosphoribosyltransferase [Oligoflexia bacterium]|nr:amidophosphoribosyltransferase [Oligoflexia bacterium]
MKKWREECGVFGIWNHPEASRITYLGLFALQHRGQESCGIVSLDKENHIHHKGLGLVADNFTEPELDRLSGRTAIGHVRYATTGDNLLTNAQPLTANLKDGFVAVAHNGNIVNAGKLREELKNDGAIFQGSNDTEVLIHLLARDKAVKFEDRVMNALKKLEGAYSLVILTSKQLFAVRDPMGFRPLSIGKLDGDMNGLSYSSWVVASETCAFDLIGAKFERDILPGEILIIENGGGKTHSLHLPEAPKKAQCIFEHVYFARPDSVVFGEGVYEARKNLGRYLAQECPIDADIVVPVPDSGVAAALGYAEESKIPFDMGIIRNHYVGRTFIEPRSHIRSFGVKIKLNPMAALLRGKRVIVIDDSIVRGTTSKKIISLVRNAGAKEIHLRIAAPPTTGPCYYGVDTPTKKELIAANQSVDEIRKFVGADTLGYLSVTGLLKAVRANSNTYCAACFDGKYPTPIYD